MEWWIGDVADHTGWAIVSQGCSIVSNSQIQEGKQKLHSRDSICWMWISCDSQEHHWISTTTTPMWDQLGRPRIQKQPATVTTYQDEPENRVKLPRSYRIRPTSRNGGPILCKFSKFQGVESRWKVWYKMIQDIWGLCGVCEVQKDINDFALWPSNIQGRWWFEAIVEVLPSFVP